MTEKKNNELKFMFIVLVVACVLFVYDVELYGDVFQFLALYLGIIILVYEKNIKRVIMLSIAAAFVVGVVYAIKFGFIQLASHNTEYASISLRPYAFNGTPSIYDYNGFPSGHTAAAFIAVGFALRFYSKRWIIFLALLAILVPPSRVLTLWHTTIQVIAGGIFSLVITYGVLVVLQKIPYFRNA